RSMPAALRGRPFHLAGFHPQAEGALLAGVDRADPDDLAVDLPAAPIADRQHHRVLAGALGGRRDGALDLQRRKRRRLGHFRVEAQVPAALRTHAGALEDGGLAVRAGARRARGPGARGAHASLSEAALSDLPLPPLPLEPPVALSPQPKSTWPRIRAPVATVSAPALTSPVRAPDSSSSTFCADSMLPSSSPATMTLWARTPPDSRAPGSMVRLPCTLTSPLNLPAMRTWPVPSILPSMVSSAAISDSFNGASLRAGLAAGVAGAGAGEVMSRIGVGSKLAAFGLSAGAAGVGAGFLAGVESFQMAIGRFRAWWAGPPNLAPASRRHHVTLHVTRHAFRKRSGIPRSSVRTVTSAATTCGTRQSGSGPRWAR